MSQDGRSVSSASSVSSVETGRYTTNVTPLTYSWKNINVYAEGEAGCCGKKKKDAPSKHILKNGEHCYCLKLCNFT